MRMEAGTVPQIPVLGYHHVHDGPDDFFRASPELLHQQMEILLAEGYTPIGPARLADLAGQTADDRYVMVTFDDAYVDFLEHAWPILHSLRIPTTLFVISDYIGGWNEWDPIRWAPHPHLDIDAIRRLHAEGVVIGSHSRTHRPLGRLWGRRLEDELRGSRHALEEIVGAAVSSFAYPGGNQSWRVRRATRSVYELGFATQADCSGATCDRYLIPRFDPCFCGDSDVFRRTLDDHCGLGRRTRG
jgi:peptidoglycan/xylan/chitin deacetylase (PgdA/CDA1 family)